MQKNSDKKEVIAYLHTHWDREWYQEYEVFRLRLLRVFDNVLNLLEQNLIPSFYFDGQVAALLDYLELRPEKEELIRSLISQKKLFIGPFYCLVDEFLTDGICFRKNLEIGLKIAQDFGCNDFIGYLADTFGHSQNVPALLSEFGIDKAIVWRGCPKDLPSEFIFNGVNTVNLVRGYFMDIFSSDKTTEEKAEFLKLNLDKIAQRSGNTLLLPIGADHLDVPEDILAQIENVNKILDEYQIKLGSPFEYFEKVKFEQEFDDELRDNSATFVLPGSYSSRLDLKQLNTLCSYKLDIIDKLQFNFGNKYENVIEYAYKLLLQNQAHDSICGCSKDSVHQENIVRYNKILQITDTIFNEITYSQPKNLTISFKNDDKHKILKYKSSEIGKDTQVISKEKGFPTHLLYDTSKIPVTEDYTTIYTMLKEFNPDGSESNLFGDDTNIFNQNIRLELEDGKLNIYDKGKCYKNFIEFVRYKDIGDSYNFGPVEDDKGEIAKIKSAKLVENGHLRMTIRIKTTFFDVDVSLCKNSKLLNMKFKWLNLLSNKLWQVKFNFPEPVDEVSSEDLNLLITREFNSKYDIRKNLPKTKGLEAKTNTAPTQRFVWSSGCGVITSGLTEYEVSNNSLLITILRSTGTISNPKNPSRTTPAGPPIETPALQMIGENRAEISFGFFPLEDWADYVEEIYPQTLILS